MIFNDTIVVLAADAPPGLFPAREQIAVSGARRRAKRRHRT